jgi:site-specific DNA-methyltransferase (adenine-specific)/site-specific DNA-methyltransferase (cytosine-N4-specific)
MDKIADGSVDMVITSPPYADRRKNSYEGRHSSVYVDWFIPIAEQIKRVLKGSGSFFLNIKAHCDKGERDLYVMKLVIAIKEDLGFRFTDEFSWTKLGVPGKFKGRFKNAFEPVYHFTKSKDFTFNPYDVATKAKDVSLARYKRKACGESNNGSGLAGMRKEITSDLALPSNHIHLVQKSNQHTIQSKHPAVFPVELPEFFIKAFSNDGEIILDPFMGSGTTGVACVNLNRDFIGIEQDDKYYEIAKKRIKEAEDACGLFK